MVPLSDSRELPRVFAPVATGMSVAVRVPVMLPLYVAVVLAARKRNSRSRSKAGVGIAPIEPQDRIRARRDDAG